MNEFSKTREIDYLKLFEHVLKHKAFIVRYSILSGILFFLLSFIVKPSFSTYSVLLPYKSSNNLTGLMQSSLALGFPDQSDDYSRLYEELFEGYDFIVNVLDDLILDQNGSEISIYSYKYDDSLSEFRNNQIKSIIYEDLIKNNIVVGYDSYTGLVSIEVIFDDPILSSNVHSYLIKKFDLYLSDLKNQKLMIKNEALLSEKLKTKNQLNNLESKKRDFLERNKNILKSPFLSTELYNIERDIKLKESSFVALSSQIQLNSVDISLEGNNFRIIQKPVDPLKPNITKIEFLLFGIFLGSIISTSLLLIRYNKSRLW
tara:strand:+ start:681 stop:1628 length:948 start_codon:yes stop_codon:yes gene_type:complete